MRQRHVIAALRVERHLDREGLQQPPRPGPCRHHQQVVAKKLAVRQSCPPLVIGRATIQHPAQPNEDLAKLQAKGAKVYVIREDLAARGIAEDRCVTEAQPLGRAELVDLMETHDQVWHW